MAPRVRVVNPLSRREVLKFGAYTSVGGVLTPGISLAQAIVTDTKGIDTRDVELTVGGARIPRLRGQAGGERALSDRRRDLRLHRQQRAPQGRRAPLRSRRLLRDCARTVPPRGRHAGQELSGHGEGLRRGDACAVSRRHPGGCRPGQGPVVGARRSSRGDRLLRRGALTLHFSAENPDVTAAVPWYGHVKRVYQDAPGVDAFSLIPKIKVPVLGLYGDKDSGIPTEDVKRFEAELKKTNPNVEFVIYPDAQHALLGRPSAGLPEGRGRGRVEALCRVLRQVPEGLSAPSGGVSPPEQKSHRDAATARWASSRPGSRRGRGSSAPGLPRG
jgi:Dienelactone hydrolase family